MAKVELGGNADVVEFCPSTPYLHILAAASYTLQEGRDEQEGAARLGGLYLFSAAHETDHPSSTLSLTKLYHRGTPGVFDVKWQPYEAGPPCLAQASADGSLTLHLLEEGPDPSALELHEKAHLDVSSSMCLYVDWNPLHSTPEVVLSHSDGSISLVNLEQTQPESSASWQAHDFEAWVVAYDAWKPQVVYSGGDDCQFCCWDMREDPRRPAFRDRKTHSMGVCSIQSNSLCENIVATGSYDENVRLFDVRMAQKPLWKAELGLGGGVWRLKWHHTRWNILLAACMHNGAAIVQIGEDLQFRVLEEYKEHTSLTYGASWYRGDAGDALDLSDKEKRPDAEDDERLRSSEVANSAGEDANNARHVGIVEETIRIEPKLTDDRMAEVSDKFRQLGVQSSVGANPLVATCSFYDRAVHLWQPRSFDSSPG